MVSVSPPRVIEHGKFGQPTRVVGCFASLAILIAFFSAFFQLHKHVDLDTIDFMRFKDRIGVTDVVGMTGSANTVTKKTLQPYQCQLHASSTVILSTDPLIVHIHNFVTPFEAQHLITLALVLLNPIRIMLPSTHRLKQRGKICALNRWSWWCA